MNKLKTNKHLWQQRNVNFQIAKSVFCSLQRVFSISNGRGNRLRITNLNKFHDNKKHYKHG